MLLSRGIDGVISPKFFHYAIQCSNHRQLWPEEWVLLPTPDTGMDSDTDTDTGTAYYYWERCSDETFWELPSDLSEACLTYEFVPLIDCFRRYPDWKRLEMLPDKIGSGVAVAG